MENLDNQYKTKNPYTVPEGYFDGLTDRIIDRVEKQQKPQKIHRLKWTQVLKPYLGLAAVFLLALFVLQAVLPLVVEPGQLLRKDTVAQVQEAPVEDIFDSQFNPSSEEIIEYLSAEVDPYELLYAGIY